MTPDEELDHLDAELERLQREHPGQPGLLRLSDRCLRGCSQWKWGQHGWTVSPGQSCAIMNGLERERRTALLAVLEGHVDGVEFVADLERLEVVPSRSASPQSSAVRAKR